MSGEIQPELGAVFDLSARTKLRVWGADRFRYLNGQISNDLRKATEKAAIHACVLNAKGRINADVFIAASGESFLIDSDAETGEQLSARLERYVIADDVQIENVTNQFALFHLLGPDAIDIVVERDCQQTTRYGSAGVDVWANIAERELLLQQFGARSPICDEATAEAFRIARAIPRWGHELTEEIIPTEANLESSAIDYAKGCYIGQEVISRIKMSGQTNKRLCGLITNAESPLRQGMRLWTTDVEAKDVGWITSATAGSTFASQIALGFVKRGYQGQGTQLEARLAEDAARSSPVIVEIAALPFAGKH